MSFNFDYFVQVEKEETIAAAEEPTYPAATSTTAQPPTVDWGQSAQPDATPEVADWAAIAEPKEVNLIIDLSR